MLLRKRCRQLTLVIFCLVKGKLYDKNSFLDAGIEARMIYVMQDNRKGHKYFSAVIHEFFFIPFVYVQNLVSLLSLALIVHNEFVFFVVRTEIRTRFYNGSLH